MKRALLVGIDYYENFQQLYGCANDAAAIHPLLQRNEDGGPNLDCRLASADDAATHVSRDRLKEMIRELLSGGAEFALLYFAGHGAPTDGGVALVTSDGTDGTPGVTFSEILAAINKSSVAEVTVILDCCFSGGATTIEALNNGLANLRDGLSVLTASRDDQVSMETAEGRGQFSTYLEGALKAGAADVLGHVNVAGLYSYLSESFGAWEQRPTLRPTSTGYTTSEHVSRSFHWRPCAGSPSGFPHPGTTIPSIRLTNQPRTRSVIPMRRFSPGCRSFARAGSWTRSAWSTCTTPQSIPPAAG